MDLKVSYSPLIGNLQPEVFFSKSDFHYLKSQWQLLIKKYLFEIKDRLMELKCHVIS